MAIFNTVTLPSDGEECQVRRLGLFELREAIKPPLSGPFTYEVDLSGKIVKAVYKIPAAPPTVRGLNKTMAAWESVELDLYRAAVFYVEHLIPEDTARYYREIAAYIINNCIDAADRPRIVTIADYDTVYHAALVPQVTRADLEQQINHVFRSEFNDLPLLEALLTSDSKTLGRADQIAVWEVQAMSESGMSEAQWSELPIGERARRIVAKNHDGWMSSLQWEADKK